MNYFSKFSSYKYYRQFSVLLFLVICFFGYYINIWINTESTDNAYLDSEISNVSSQVSGIIDEILIEENSKVIKDQIIAKIKNDDYNALFEKSKSVAENAKRDIELIEQNIKLALIEQNKSKEALEFAEMNLKLTEVDFNRIKKLSKDNFASKQKLDSTEIALEKAKNDFSQADLNMQISKVKLDLLEVQRLGSVAKYSIAMQEMYLAQRNLDNTIIRSPIDGIIGNSSLQLGNYIRTGVILFSVVPEQLYIEANFKETQISKFKPGMETIILFDSQNDREIKGVIRNIAPATGSKFTIIPSANATGNFTKIVQRVPVIIDFDLPEDLKGKLAPGMSALVKIRTNISK